MLLRLIRHFIEYLCIFIFVVFVFSCTPQKDKYLPDNSVESLDTKAKSTFASISQNQAVINFIDSLTMEQQIGQLFLVCIEGTSVNPETGENDIGGENCGTVPAGGYIIFRHNCTDSAAQVISLIGNVRTYYNNQNQIQPYFSIDHEGGTVNRLSYLASPLPSQHSVAKFLNEDLASKMYTYAAMQLHALGFQLNFAPVVEVQRSDNVEFLGRRTYGSLEKTVEYSKIAINSYKAQGVGCVIKHFPGNTATDPHRGLPVLTVTCEQLDLNYAEPFKQLSDETLSGILMSHAVVLALDAEHPSCLSAKVTEYLREYTGYKGLIFSDDLLMEALGDCGYTPSEAVKRALNAGVQVLMVLQPNYHQFVAEIEQNIDTDNQFKIKIRNAVSAIIRAKIDMGLLVYKQDKIGNWSIESASIDTLYNLQAQITAFETAKEKGSWLYGEYFGK
jgi:beta-N-acetylhexosaminidase